MIAKLDEAFIKLKTNQEGNFKVTISLIDGSVIFSEVLSSNNKEIILKGFSLHTHTVVISPIKL